LEAWKTGRLEAGKDALPGTFIINEARKNGRLEGRKAVSNFRPSTLPVFLSSIVLCGTFFLNGSSLLGVSGDRCLFLDWFTVD
jgi:hypothetical protein